MKKGKILTLMLSLICSASVLTSCGNSEQELAACKSALEKSICVVTSSGSPLQPGVSVTLNGDATDALTLTTSQVVKIDNARYTVSLTWSWDEEYNNLISKKTLADDTTHERMTFNYPAKAEAPDGTNVTFKVEAKVGSQKASADFKALLSPLTIKFEEMTIADLYKQKEGKEEFAFMNDKGYIGSNYGQDFYYVKVPGKLVYLAPDKNFGILADGNKYVNVFKFQLYSDPSVAVVGSYLKISASIAQYYGNIQLSYIKNIEVMEDHSDIAEPVNISITNDINEKGADGFKPFYSGDVANAMINSVTGVAMNPKKPGPTDGTEIAAEFSEFKGTTRFTFELKLDDKHIIKVAYDYHTGSTDTEEGKATRNAFVSVLNSAIDGTTKLTVKGCLLYSNSSNKIGSDGGWSIVPLVEGDIVAA